MAWLDPFEGRIVALDTAPLVYFIEEHPGYLHLVTAFFEAVEDAKFQVVTSYVTLLEVLVHPISRNDPGLASQYRGILLDARGLTSLPVNEHVAEGAASLRAQYNLRTPDAIQLSTGIQAGASFFLTNDLQLPAIPELQVLTLDDLLLADQP